MRRAIRAAVAAGAVLAASAAIAAAPAVDLEDAAKRGWLRTDHYGVFCGDVRVGWMRRALVRAKVGERDLVARDVELRIDVAGDGNHTVTSTRTVFAADGDQSMVEATLTQAEGSHVSSRRIVRHGERFDVTTERRGARTEGAVAAVPLTLSDELGIERATLAGAPVKVASFDLGSMTPGVRTCTAAAVEGEPGAFDVTVVAGRTKEVLRMGADGGLVSGALGARFSYRREPESVAKDPAYRVPLEKLSRVPLLDGDAPAKLGDRARISRLVLAWDAPRDRTFPSVSRQSARRDGASVVVEVRRDAKGAKVTDAEREDALRDEPGLDLRAPGVGDLVARILSGTSQRPAQVVVLLEAVSTEMKKEIVLGTPTVVEILNDPRGDCTEHARLYVALCRVAGIPARTVDGLAWMGDEAGTFGWHTWAEVEVAGEWLAVDPVTAESPAPASHIVVDTSPDARTSLWGAKLRLVSVDRDPAPAEPPPPPPK